ncbi:hypothetical protein GcM1_128004 [Golovinomyces cichoracearum]|uniref:Uncharacterized protein n=1 Tax=Golovinomyces cichoracearum TaxID=62708 RepID=A0A420JC04_9PEZI|nr:hypothetical protein GcM1_128004 [Golovinomyces cichoracearum]
MQFSTYIITQCLFGSLVSSSNTKDRNPPIHQIPRTIICDEDNKFTEHHLEYGTKRACSSITERSECFSSGCIRPILSKLKPSRAKKYRGTIFKIKSVPSLSVANPHDEKILYEWEFPKMNLKKRPKFKYHIIISFDTQSDECAFIGIEMRSRKSQQECQDMSNDPDRKPSPNSLSRSF